MMHLPVDDVGDAVEENDVRQRDPRVVHPRGAVGQHGEDEVHALRRRARRRCRGPGRR